MCLSHGRYWSAGHYCNERCALCRGWCAVVCTGLPPVTLWLSEESSDSGYSKKNSIRTLTGIYRHNKCMTINGNEHIAENNAFLVLKFKEDEHSLSDSPLPAVSNSAFGMSENDSLDSIFNRRNYIIDDKTVVIITFANNRNSFDILHIGID